MFNKEKLIPKKVDVLFLLFVVGAAGTILVVMAVVPALMHSVGH
jgi:hypothetical protein